MARFERFWAVSMHFAERVLERVGKDECKRILAAIYREMNETVLQKIYHCLVYGYKQRMVVGDYIVCYVWNDDQKKVILTTLYKRGCHRSRTAL